MITITLTVETNEQMEQVIEVLHDAEEESILDFPFNLQIDNT